MSRAWDKKIESPTEFEPDLPHTDRSKTVGKLYKHGKRRLGDG